MARKASSQLMGQGSGRERHAGPMRTSALTMNTLMLQGLRGENRAGLRARATGAAGDLDVGQGRVPIPGTQCPFSAQPGCCRLALRSTKMVTEIQCEASLGMLARMVKCAPLLYGESCRQGREESDIQGTSPAGGRAAALSGFMQMRGTQT